MAPLQRSKRYFDFNSTRQPARNGIRYPLLRLIDPIIANSVTLVVGTSGSVLSDLQTEADGNYYTIAELALSPAIDVVIKFTGVDFFNFLRVKAAYEGSSTHDVIIQLYNFETALYETRHIIHNLSTFDTTPGAEVIDTYEVKVERSDRYISSGEVWLRLCHPMMGNASHDLHIDYVSLY